MKRYLNLLVFAALFLFSHFASALEPTAKTEIDHLIQYTEESGNRFVRAGKEYTAKEGAAHLRMKLGHAGGRIKTAEDFISGVASKSYLTGEVYQVKTPDGKSFPTGSWLKEELARFRESKGSK